MNEIDVKELKSLIGRVNIIDLRDSYIYNLGHIPTAKNIPYNFLIMNPNIYLNKSDKYYLYCDQGIKSSKICTNLLNSGYQVINVIGGYNSYNS